MIASAWSRLSGPQMSCRRSGQDPGGQGGAAPLGCGTVVSRLAAGPPAGDDQP